MALFVVFTHRSNINRMREGSENRMIRALLSRRY
jgi:glycerol-3-phosphate acyltransferase PlsY